MNASRAFIIDSVLRNQPAAVPLPEVPAFARALPTLQAFGAALARMGGQLVVLAPDETAQAWLGRRWPADAVIVSATPEVRGTREIGTLQAPAALHDVDVGIVRAGFGVVETGSVYLSESEFGIPAIGFLVQHLVVLLDPAALLPDLHHAYRQRGFFEARYATLMTGPSATADIEGVLIRGAQGIRSLTVLAVSACP